MHDIYVHILQNYSIMRAVYVSIYMCIVLSSMMLYEASSNHRAHS